MTCSQVDYVFALTVAAFVTVSLIAAWWFSSLIKVLELRHPSTFNLLGRPNPNEESDARAYAVLSFLIRREYLTLKDDFVNKHVHVLRLCVTLDTLLFVALVGCLVLAPSSEALLRLTC